MIILTRGYGQTDRPTDRLTNRQTLLPIELLSQLKMKFAFLIKGSCTSIKYTSKEILDKLKKATSNS